MKLSELEKKNWSELDPIYSAARRKLFRLGKWLLGPLHVRNSTRNVIKSLNEHGLSIEDKVFCDLGCGTQHPYGNSALIYLNGAKSAIATDLTPIKNNTRSAEALYDLLLQCLAHPDEYRLTDVSIEEFFLRIHNFNLNALKQGDLINGIGDAPIQHLTMSIYEPEIPPESIDIISSRAVLEHLLELEEGCNQMLHLMKPGGIGIHLVDFADHRAYKSKEYNFWSFLTESDEEWSQNMKHIMPHNRLRASQVYKIFEETGFEIINYAVVKGRYEIPADIREKILSPFSLMSEEDLTILYANYIVKKSDVAKPQDENLLSVGSKTV